MMEEKHASWHWVAEMEMLAADIFRNCGFEVQMEHSGRDTGCDFYTRKDGKNYGVELKVVRNSQANDQAVLKAAQKLSLKREHAGETVVTVLVVMGVVSEKVENLLKRPAWNIVLVDIRNLLYMAQSDGRLYDELVAALHFSVNGLEPRMPWGLGLAERKPNGTNSESHYADIPGIRKSIGIDFGYSSLSFDSREQEGIGSGKIGFTLNQVPAEQKAPSNTDLCEEIRNWRGGRGVSSSGDYEKLCTRVLKRLFADDLTLWREQAKSDVGLFRFDLICKIKRDNQKDFWETAERYFNSKYIIFEFKNYGNQVTQKEVFTTVRYLYKTALRSIAVIISPNGIDNHADKAIRGILRDEGKLILTLTNEELIWMLEMQEEKESPAEYLSDKLDDLLIDLEK